MQRDFIKMIQIKEIGNDRIGRFLVQNQSSTTCSCVRVCVDVQVLVAKDKICIGINGNVNRPVVEGRYPSCYEYYCKDHLMV